MSSRVPSRCDGATIDAARGAHLVLTGSGVSWRTSKKRQCSQLDIRLYAVPNGRLLPRTVSYQARTTVSNDSFLSAKPVLIVDKGPSPILHGNRPLVI